MKTALLLLFLAGGPAAQDDKAAEEALETFKTAFKSTSEADRVAALTELAKVHHLKTLARLASLLTHDAPSIRIAAAKAISGFSELKKPAASTLVAALGGNVKDNTVEVALYDSIGKLEEPTALPALHHGFDDKDTPVAKSAIQATGQTGSAASIDPLIACLIKLEKTVKAGAGGTSVPYTTTTSGGQNVTIQSGNDNPVKRAQELIPVVNKALSDITRETNGTSENWSAWWARNRGTFKPSK